ncbi:MAG: hypothetical protein HC899_07670 [Leptolyngbyaceae cyanobacterium SM1_4_3]|nr:hypothetical protein [Leptolyngbyaceae cyanobacterium SM1_4_3]
MKELHDLSQQSQRGDAKDEVERQEEQKDSNSDADHRLCHAHKPAEDGKSDNQQQNQNQYFSNAHCAYLIQFALTTLPGSLDTTPKTIATRRLGEAQRNPTEALTGTGARSIAHTVHIGNWALMGTLCVDHSTFDARSDAGGVGLRFASPNLLNWNY